MEGAAPLLCHTSIESAGCEDWAVGYFDLRRFTNLTFTDLHAIKLQRL